MVSIPSTRPFGYHHLCPFGYQLGLVGSKTGWVALVVRIVAARIAAVLASRIVPAVLLCHFGYHKERKLLVPVSAINPTGDEGLVGEMLEHERLEVLGCKQPGSITQINFKMLFNFTFCFIHKIQKKVLKHKNGI